MLLTYLDESYTKERYYIAALMVPETQARSLTAALDAIVMQASFKYAGINPDAELHGYDLVAAKKDWEGLAKQVRVRIGIYNKAFQAIANHDVKIIVRGVNVGGLDRRYGARHDHPHSVVLTHLIERVDECAERHDETAIMIADEIDGQAAYRRDLWAYQRSRTWGYRGRQIKRIVDTIHFAPSSSSRLVQAADLIAYMYRRRAMHTEPDERATRANDALWARIEPRVVHRMCWHP